MIKNKIKINFNNESKQKSKQWRLYNLCVEKYGRIDYLVNNGGGQFPCPAADMSLKVTSTYYIYFITSNSLRIVTYLDLRLRVFLSLRYN